MRVCVRVRLYTHASLCAFVCVGIAREDVRMHYASARLCICTCAFVPACVHPRVIARIHAARSGRSRY